MNQARTVSNVSQMICFVKFFVMSRVKVKLYVFSTKHHVMKTYGGSGGITPCILNLGTRLS